MLRITRRFQGHTSQAVAKFTCRRCNKKRTRVFKQTCYDNGFHNLRDTMAKNQIEVNRLAKQCEKKADCGCEQ